MRAGSRSHFAPLGFLASPVALRALASAAAYAGTRCSPLAAVCGVLGVGFPPRATLGAPPSRQGIPPETDAVILPYGKIFQVAARVAATSAPRRSSLLGTPRSHPPRAEGRMDEPRGVGSGTPMLLGVAPAGAISYPAFACPGGVSAPGLPYGRPDRRFAAASGWAVSVFVHWRTVSQARRTRVCVLDAVPLSQGTERNRHI